MSLASNESNGTKNVRGDGMARCRTLASVLVGALIVAACGGAPGPGGPDGGGDGSGPDNEQPVTGVFIGTLPDPTGDRPTLIIQPTVEYPHEWLRVIGFAKGKVVMSLLARRTSFDAVLASAEQKKWSDGRILMLPLPPPDELCSQIGATDDGACPNGIRDMNCADPPCIQPQREISDAYFFALAGLLDTASDTALAAARD
jgi:hypothetical protein